MNYVERWMILAVDTNILLDILIPNTAHLHNPISKSSSYVNLGIHRSWAIYQKLCQI